MFFQQLEQRLRQVKHGRGNGEHEGEVNDQESASLSVSFSKVEEVWEVEPQIASLRPVPSCDKRREGASWMVEGAEVGGDGNV